MLSNNITIGTMIVFSVILVQEAPSRTYFDDFDSYPSSVYSEKPYIQLDGYGRWTAREWNIMRGEANMNGNYIMLRQFPPGENNHATYHVHTRGDITYFKVRFKYMAQQNCKLSVYVSSDGYDWVDVTDRLGVYSEEPAYTKNASADLTSLIDADDRDVYIRFRTRAWSGDYWMSAIDDFRIDIEVEETERKQFSDFDDFDSYPSSVYSEKPYIQLDGYGRWTAREWNIMRGEANMNGNYIMLRQFPPGENNCAIYHIQAPGRIVTLSVGFKYMAQQCCKLSVYISSDGYDWLDITETLGVYSEEPAYTRTVSADLSQLVSDYNRDIYIGFKTRAWSGDYWMSAIDEFWIKGTAR